MFIFPKPVVPCFLEVLAANNNVSWGACHFVGAMIESKNQNWNISEPWSKCPPPSRNYEFPRRGGFSYWHLPTYVLPHLIPNHYPYDNVPPGLAMRPKMYFTVVRNPYDRLISLFYYFNHGKNDADAMNAFILIRIRDKACIHAPKCYTEYKCFGTFLCGTQHKFIFEGSKRVIDHVLRFESLHEDFAKLSKQYSLNWSIPTKRPAKRGGTLTVANLTDESIRFINDVFREDFNLGGGYKMIHPKNHLPERKRQRPREHNENHLLRRKRKQRKKQTPSPRNQQLQYFHIPKTAGVMMETLGGENNLSWGACNFLGTVTNPDWYKSPPWSKCPPLPLENTTFPLKQYSYWHLPIYVLPHYLSFDPYSLAGKPKEFFTVVRNPYDRLISAYYYFHPPDRDLEANNATYMNDYILTEVRNKACPAARRCLKPPYKCGGLLTCGTQHDYVFDGNGTQVIQHVLHYESLQSDFRKLAKQYGLKFSVPNKQKLHPKYKRKTLTAANLTDESIRFINRVFRKDFELGSGYKMIHPRKGNAGD